MLGETLKAHTPELCQSDRQCTTIVCFSVQIQSDIRSASQQKWLAIAILLLVLIISPVIVILVVNATNTIQAFASTLVQRTIELQREKHKGDTLLQQMLPRPVVRHLKQHRQASTSSSTITANPDSFSMNVE
jgi:hypothetical protein